ncbi:replication protein RepA [Benzoatithermus flavus]|uniref:Replication protein RepA n=1 Tax=Benzoatithermus flavus TaxID=3108223 RepID=A0ABU8XV07_9PROT
MKLHDLVLQHGRDAARELVPSEQRHLVDLAAAVLGDEKLSLAYLYSGFAMTGLPHRRLASDDQVWKRDNGRFSLIVEPGVVLDERGEPVRYGVPYGSRARLILLYLQSEAIRTSSRVISLGASMHDWMEKLGVNPGGTNYKAIREQARRLSACTMTVGWRGQGGVSGFNRASIVSAMMFVPRRSDGRQSALWDETAELSHEFYEALRQHPVPVSEAAIRCIQNSSAVIDVYIWLCYRLRDLKRSIDVPWPALHAQFGSEYKTLRQFRAKFKEMLAEARAVYPGAEVEVTHIGVRLHPSVPAVQPVLVGEQRSIPRAPRVEEGTALRLKAATVARFRQLYPGLDFEHFEQRWIAAQVGRPMPRDPDAQFLAWMAACQRRRA